MSNKFNIFTKIRISLFLILFISLVITKKWFLLNLIIGNVVLNYNIMIFLLFIFLIILEYKKQYRNNLYNIIYCLLCLLCFCTMFIMYWKVFFNILSVKDYLFHFYDVHMSISYTVEFKFKFYDALVAYVIDNKIEFEYKIDFLKIMQCRSNIQFLNMGKYTLNQIKDIIRFQLQCVEVIYNNYIKKINDELFYKYNYDYSLLYNIGSFIIIRMKKYLKQNTGSKFINFEYNERKEEAYKNTFKFFNNKIKQGAELLTNNIYVNFVVKNIELLPWMIPMIILPKMYIILSFMHFPVSIFDNSFIYTIKDIIINIMPHLSYMIQDNSVIVSVQHINNHIITPGVWNIFLKSDEWLSIVSKNNRTVIIMGAFTTAIIYIKVFL